MSLYAIGDRVWLAMVDDRTVHASSVRDALLYDFEGESWPKCSALIGPFARGRRRVELEGEAARWFGSGYEARAGSLELPPRRLSLWRSLGPARRLFYDRRGKLAQWPTSAKQHPFSRAPELYTRGAFLRLELGGGCLVNWRGFVRP